MPCLPGACTYPQSRDILGDMLVRRCAMLVCAAALGSGCGDEVVGFFGAGSTGDLGLDTTAAPSTADASDGATSNATSNDGTGGGTSGVPGDTGFVPPGCFSDDFEDGIIDPLWNPWTEEDSALAEVSGMLKLTPPSFGLWDTGVVVAYNYVFPFVDGHVRLRVPLPPAVERPVLLFLSVGDGNDTNLSIQLSGGLVIADVSIGLEQQYRQEFPMAYPAWVGLRAEGDLVHFEISDDGVTFTELGVTPKVGTFEVASALIMAQTFDVDTDRSAIGVDDLEVCVQ